MEIAWSARKHGIDDDDILHAIATTSAQRKADDFIDSISPADMRDGSHLRDIAAASRAVDEADERLREAVKAAREAGDSWTAIGLALGTSKQNAHRKFGH